MSGGNWRRSSRRGRDGRCTYRGGSRLARCRTGEYSLVDRCPGDSRDRNEHGREYHRKPYRACSHDRWQQSERPMCHQSLHHIRAPEGQHEQSHGRWDQQWSDEPERHEPETNRKACQKKYQASQQSDLQRATACEKSRSCGSLRVAKPLGEFPDRWSWLVASGHQKCPFHSRPECEHINPGYLATE